MQKDKEAIRDSFNRQIDYLRISITDKCNLKCVYCMPDKGLNYFSQKDIMTDEEIVRFISIAHKHGLRKVRITGGEPLVRKNIVSLISDIKATGIQDLSLTTNGIMLTGIAQQLKDAGLDRVNISLDTLDANKYKGITKGGDISQVWDSINEAEHVGLAPIKINVVPMRGLNDDEILAFASLTFDKDYHIRFIELMPAKCNTTWSDDKRIDSEEVLRKIATLGKLEKFSFKGKGPSRNFRIEGARGVIGIISAVSDHFCDYCNRLRLTADGKIRPCLFSKEMIDIKGPMRAGASDRDIEAIFCKAVRVKPEGHKLKQNKNSSTAINTMSKIGG